MQIHADLPPPLEMLGLCQRAELSSTCLGITINSIAQAWLDPYPAKPSAQLRQPGEWQIDSGGNSHTIFSILPLSYSLWCGREEESCPLKPIYAEIFGMLLLSFFPR